MARLIDADALVEKWQARHDFFVDGWGGFDKMSFSTKGRVDELTNCVADVVNAPTVDAVPVVRCKDCKHYALPEEFDTFGRCTNGYICVSYRSEIYPEPDDFCSYGERRTDA